MESGHDKREIAAVLNSVEVAVVSTFAGEQLRSRMMHYAADEDFNMYLATMKGDPKTVQLTHHPSIAILVHKPSDNVSEAKEVEITGKAFIIKNEQERNKAFQLIALRSPVVKYLLETHNEDRLDCIKILPERIKYRVFGEIVQGLPPTVVEFPQHRAVVSDFLCLRKKIKNWVLALRGSF
ncbi:MAG: pyridoxamine 5'-phosphate oxidase family protein, partial [Candidatus Zixiibacteriota bacterium]